ncbi:MAG: type I restriction endonuclease [Pelolinea sp.]|nr:type I restriction endonuclease [Pelolinea sp.]
MPRITESGVEELAIQRLEALGYHYLYGPDLAPDGAHPQRARFEDVLLLDQLKAAVARINPAIPLSAREDALKQLQRLHSPQLISLLKWANNSPLESY